MATGLDDLSFAEAEELRRSNAQYLHMEEQRRLHADSRAMLVHYLYPPTGGPVRVNEDGSEVFWEFGCIGWKATRPDMLRLKEFVDRYLSMTEGRA